ncbi:MAG: response regulator [Acidobacteriota bacterium]
MHKQSGLSAEPPRGHRERILLVDDERVLRELGRLWLEGQGYRVQVSADGDDAMALLEGSPDDFDLVITDLTMPGLRGTELAQRAIELKPGLPVLLLTGHGTDELAHLVDAGTIREILTKPLRPAELGIAVRRHLDGASPS